MNPPIGILTFMSEKKGGCGAAGFLLMFGLFWTAITGAFDAFIGYNLWRQMQAESWPVTAGEVIRSEVKTSTDSDGTTYRAEVTFRYEVGGQRYEADTWRFGAWGSSDSSAARDVVQRFPAGAAVEVRYNPNDPSSAVLEVGVQGDDLFLLLFMTPFNVVMLGIWYIGLAQLFKREVPKVGGARIQEDINHVRVRLPALPAVATGGIVAGISSFIMIFIVGFGFGFSPPWGVVVTAWCVVLGLAVVAGFIQSYRTRSGLADLLIDLRHQMVSLPSSRLFRPGALVPVERFTATRIDRVETRGKNSTTVTFHLYLQYADEAGDSAEVKVTSSSDRADAEALADWLNDRLSIATTNVNDTSSDVPAMEGHSA